MRVESVLVIPTPHSKHALRTRARRPAMRAPLPKTAGAFSFSEESTLGYARYMRSMLARAPRLYLSRTEEYGRVGGVPRRGQWWVHL
jgi:hypothetical protein